MYFLTTEFGHLALSLAAGYVCFRLYRRMSSWVFSLISGFLVDLDHLFDYFVFRGLQFDLGDFISSRYYHDTNQVYILLHSWELVVVLCVLFIFSKKKYIFCPLVLGLALHLVWDHLTNPAYWRTYFLIGRYLEGFTLDKLFAY
ncbi:MAG: hypothetical protein KatS3mg101_0327 [Patescibacteria group bacterium]|nr:MAG: hypothetical protein KatS3mg101_0327 [Patescibacteria group bacterium]